MSLLRFRFHQEFSTELKFIISRIDRVLASDELSAAAKGEVRRVRSKLIELAAMVAHESLSLNSSLIPQLTAAEDRVARELQSGKLTREISNNLHISETTVKTHLKHIYRKLGVRNRAEAISLLLIQKSPEGD